MVLSRIRFSLFTLVIIGLGGCRIAEKKVNAITKIDNSMEEESKEQPKKPLEYVPIPDNTEPPKWFNKVIINSKVIDSHDGIVVEGSHGDNVYISNVVVMGGDGVGLRVGPALPAPKQKKSVRTIIDAIIFHAEAAGIPDKDKQRINIVFEEMITKLRSITNGKLITPEKLNDPITDSIIHEHLTRIYEIAKEIKCDPIMRYMETI